MSFRATPSLWVLAVPLLCTTAVAWRVEGVVQDRSSLTFRLVSDGTRETEAHAFFAVPTGIRSVRVDAVQLRDSGERITDATAMEQMRRAVTVEVHDVRDLKLAHVRMFGQGQLDPTSESYWLRSMDLTLRFSGVADPGRVPVTAGQSAREAPFEALWRALLDNYETSLSLRTRPLPPVRSATLAQAIDAMRQRGDRPLVVEVEGKGLFRVTGADLRAAGADLSRIVPSRLAVWFRGEPIHRVAPPRAEPGLKDDDAILFWVDDAGTRASPRRAYWLTWGDAPGALAPPVLMAAASSAAATSALFTERLGEDREHVQQLRGIDGSDEWADGTLGLSRGYWYIRRFSLADLVRGSTAWLDTRLVRVEGPEVPLEWQVNGHIVHRATVSTFGQLETIRFPIPDQVLNQGENELRLHITEEIPRRESHVAFVETTIEYLRELRYRGQPLAVRLRDDVPAGGLHRVACPAGTPLEAICLNPQAGHATPALRLVEGGLEGPLAAVRGAHCVIAAPADCAVPAMVRAAEEDLRARPPAADYLAIGPRAFHDAMEPLLAFRRTQGLRTAWWDAEAVWDAFGDGMMDDLALRRAIRHAIASAEGPPPSYVVLVGDASWDTWDRQGSGFLPLMPTHDLDGQYPIPVDLWLVAGDEQTQLPDALVGRLSVATPAELESVVTKLLTWERETSPGLWCARRLLAADARMEPEFASSPLSPDPDRVSTAALRLDDFPYSDIQQFFRDSRRIRHSPQATAHLIAAFDEGLSLVEYFGHGGVGVWSPHRLLLAANRTDSDVRRMAPNRRLPVVLNWSCLTGRFNEPPPYFGRCVGEELVFQPDRGALAFWGDAGYGHTGAHSKLSNGFREALYRKNLDRVGLAAGYATIQGTLRDNQGHTAQRMVLIGDPASRLRTPNESLDLRCRTNAAADGRRQIRLECRWPGGPDEGWIEAGLLGAEDVLLSATAHAALKGASAVLSLPVAPDIDSDTLEIVAVAWSGERSAAARASVALGLPAVDLTVHRPVFAEGVVVLRASAHSSARPIRLLLSTAGGLATVASGTVADGTLTVPAPAGGFLTVQAEVTEAGPPDGLGRIVRREICRFAVPPPRTAGVAGPELRTWPAGRANWPDDALVVGRPYIVSVSVPLEPEADPPSARLAAFAEGASLVSGATPSVLHGGSIVVSATVTSASPGALPVRLELDRPAGGAPASWVLPVLRPAKLVLSPTDVVIRPEKRRRGDTVWFEMTVANSGEVPAAAGNVLLIYDGATGKPLASQETERMLPVIEWPKMAGLAPGASKQVSVRWDPYDAVGSVTAVVRLEGPDADRQSWPISFHIDPRFADYVLHAEHAYRQGNLEEGRRRDRLAFQVFREDHATARSMVEREHSRLLEAYLLCASRLGEWSAVEDLLGPMREAYFDDLSLEYLWHTARLHTAGVAAATAAGTFAAIRDDYRYRFCTGQEVLGLGAAAAEEAGEATRAVELYRRALETYPLHEGHWRALLALLREEGDRFAVSQLIQDHASRVGAAFWGWSRWAKNPAWHGYGEEGVTPESVARMERLAQEAPWATSLYQGVALGYALLDDAERAYQALGDARILAATGPWPVEMLALRGLLAVQTGRVIEGRGLLLHALHLDDGLALRKFEPAELFGDDLAKRVNCPSLAFRVNRRTDWEEHVDAPLRVPVPDPVTHVSPYWKASVPCWFEVLFDSQVEVDVVEVYPSTHRIQACELLLFDEGAAEDRPAWTESEWGSVATVYRFTPGGVRAKAVRLDLTEGHTNNLAYLTELRVFARPHAGQTDGP